MNGYETPRHLFAFAQLERVETFSVELNIAKLAEVLGRDVGQLVGYRRRGEVDPSRLEMGGQPVTHVDIDVANPKLCPECVQELGFIPAWTDLTLMDACPHHRRQLLTKCPSCRTTLTWLRPGVLKCRCGADLAGARGTRISDEHVAFLSGIHAKVTGGTMPASCGRPTALFEAMSLHGLLSWAQNVVRHERTAVEDASSSIAANAGRLFANWPEHLAALLRRRPLRDTSGTNSPLSKQAVERVLFKNITAASDVALLRDVLATCAVPETEMPAMTQPAALSRAPATATPCTGRTRRPYVATRRPIGLASVKKKSDGQSFGQRAAAKRVGLPVSVLQALRRAGHFEVRNKSSRVVCFHEVDLGTFEAKFAALRTCEQDVAAERQCLTQVMARKFKFSDGKAELVGAILDGTLPVIGRQGDGIGGLLLDRSRVDRIVEQARSRAFGAALTPSEVGKLLHCDPLAVVPLIAAGHLTGQQHAAGWRIRPESVKQFASQYQSVASLAKARRTSSRSILPVLVSAGVELLSVERGYGKGPQPFVRVEDAGLLG